MNRVNPSMNDVHWWVYIHHPIQSLILLFLNIFITYYAIKNREKLPFENIILLLFSYLILFIMIKYSEDAISIFAFFPTIFLCTITFMKIKYDESR